LIFKELVRIKNEYGDIISMKERPTGAEKLQTNFLFDLLPVS